MFIAKLSKNIIKANVLRLFHIIIFFLGCPVLCSRFRVRFSNATNIIPNCFYLRKVRISAKIFHGIDKMTIFAEEKCGYPQKSFVDYGYSDYS